MTKRSSCLVAAHDASTVARASDECCKGRGGLVGGGLVIQYRGSYCNRWCRTGLERCCGGIHRHTICAVVGASCEQWCGRNGRAINKTLSGLLVINGTYVPAVIMHYKAARNSV